MEHKIEAVALLAVTLSDACHAQRSPNNGFIKHDPHSVPFVLAVTTLKPVGKNMTVAVWL